MNKPLCILFFFVIISCTKNQIFETPLVNNNKYPITTEIEAEPKWLIIGGGRVDNDEKQRKYDYYLESEAENITEVSLWVNPKNDTHPVKYEFIATGLEGIESLVNLQRLRINGLCMDEINFSPLIPLRRLNEIIFSNGAYDKLTRIPNLSAIASRELITSIQFESSALINMNNIEFLPNLREILVESFSGELNDISALSSLQHIEILEILSNGVYNMEIGVKPKLKRLRLSGKQVDAKGIEKFKSLEYIYFFDSNVINTEYLSELKNLEFLKMTIREPKPNINFLEGMESLKYLIIEADSAVWNNDDVEIHQILDLSPIGNLSQLVSLDLWGFILQNVAVLDKLDNLERVRLQYSVLKDGSEKSIKPLIFHPDYPSYAPVWGVNE